MNIKAALALLGLTVPTPRQSSTVREDLGAPKGITKGERKKRRKSSKKARASRRKNR